MSKRGRWVLVPVMDELNFANVWEHTPLNPWKSEYPRFLRPPRFEGRTQYVFVPATMSLNEAIRLAEVGW